ncbi:MAG: hypothetical protein J1F02_02760 [Lachnospiraceae bacterium]|nr:hypothetical protein [Lachnospiraceae bacterium]
MDIRYRLYPYPVLAYFNDDYIDSKFEVIGQCEKNGYDIEVKINVLLENQKLFEMIKEGKALIVYHLECSQSGYRNIHRTDQLQDRVTVKASLLNGELHVCTFILANENLNDYYNDKFNPEYTKPIKFIEKGCVLAVGKQFNWNITKVKSDLLKSSSPFRIIKNMDPNVSEMIVEYESSHHIIIKLNEKDLAIYKSMRDDPGVRDILNSAIVVPALVYVLGELAFTDESTLEAEFGNQSWYLSIKQTLEKNFKIKMSSLKGENIFSLAQRMLRTPINNALEQLSTVGSKADGEEGEY